MVEVPVLEALQIPLALACPMLLAAELDQDCFALVLATDYRRLASP